MLTTSPDGAARWLAGFERALGDGREWCAAGTLTIADFLLCELLANVRAVYAGMAGVPDVLVSYPRLRALVARFEALPRVDAFLASPAVKALTWYGPGASFRGPVSG